MQPLTIIEHADPALSPVLRQTAQIIDDVHAPWLQTLIDRLLVTVKQANGVGIAAPQVGQPYQLMIVASRPNLRYPHAPTMEPTVMLNPRILAYAPETVQDWEGCLSVPGLRGRISRSVAIDIEYTDRQGRLQRQELTDFVARIFQHEWDHFQGILFPDRVADPQDLVTEEVYQALLTLPPLSGNP